MKMISLMGYTGEGSTLPSRARETMSPNPSQQPELTLASPQITPRARTTTQPVNILPAPVSAPQLVFPTHTERRSLTASSLREVIMGKDHVNRIPQDQVRRDTAWQQLRRSALAAIFETEITIQLDKCLSKYGRDAQRLQDAVANWAVSNGHSSWAHDETFVKKFTENLLRNTNTTARRRLDRASLQPTCSVGRPGKQSLCDVGNALQSISKHCGMIYRVGKQD